MLALGQYYQERLQYSIACQYLESSPKIQENGNITTQLILDTMKSLTFNLVPLDRMEDAESTIRNALKMSDKAFPEKRDSNLLNVLAYILQYKGDYYAGAESSKYSLSNTIATWALRDFTPKLRPI